MAGLGHAGCEKRGQMDNDESEGPYCDTCHVHMEIDHDCYGCTDCDAYEQSKEEAKVNGSH